MGLISLISKNFLPVQTTGTAGRISQVSNNPFGNPFVLNNSQQAHTNYAKNNPVNGGYFAGYHNGKPNIVGQRLFLEA